jgi:hypothetical protein
MTMGKVSIVLDWKRRCRERLTKNAVFHGGDDLQMLIHNRNGFIHEAFDIRVFRCGRFSFKCLGIRFVVFDHAGDIGIVEIRT